MRTRNTIWQYNFSKNAFNSGYYLYDPDGVNWGENTFRYNISERDSTAGYFGFGAISISVVGAPRVYIYGNTVLNDRVYTGQPYQNPNQGGYGISMFGNVGGLIANNLFMVSANISWDGIPAGGGCAGFNARQSTAGWAPTVVIKNNHWHCLNSTWWENWWAMTSYPDFPALATATGKFQATTTGNPMITAGGTGPNGYVLQRLSPMIGSGLDYSALVPSPPTTDYFGNAVPAPGYNRGADGAAHP